MANLELNKMDERGSELSKMSPFHEKLIEFDPTHLCQVRLEPNNFDDLTTFWNDTSQPAEIFGDQHEALFGISDLKSNDSCDGWKSSSPSFLDMLSWVQDPNGKTKDDISTVVKETNTSKEFQCEKCKIGFTTKENLSFHIKWVHGYSCDFCSYKTNFKNNLQRHIMGQHLGREKLKCKLCHIYLATDRTLNDHLKVIHRTENIYECVHCPKSFKSKTCLKNHIKFVHTGIRPLQCNQCEKKFKSKRDLNHHKKVHIKALLYLFPCAQCNKSFKNASELAYHINIVHSKERRFMCNICNVRFRTNVNLKTHLKNSSCKIYKCTFCPKIYRYESELKYHERWHVGNIDTGKVLLKKEQQKEDIKIKNIQNTTNNNCISVTCEICSIKFNNNNILSKHMSAVHKEFPYKCQECKQTFELEPVFFHHLTSHDTIKKYFNCNKCFRVFKAVKSLNRHLSRNVQNDVCSKL